MKRMISIELEEPIYELFEMAVKLNDDKPENVLQDLVKEYIARSFSREARSFDSNRFIDQQPISFKRSEHYGKALRKIGKWAAKPEQINAKILRAFLQLTREMDTITVDDLKRRCSDAEHHPEVYVKTFSSNFDQMKYDSAKSNGKVFVVDEQDRVSIWEHVAPEVTRYKALFLQKRTTEKGYVNRNRQENMGKTDMMGTDHMQWLYEMRCLNCGSYYHANGSDIFQKKCPVCDGGADTGR